MGIPKPWELPKDKDQPKDTRIPLQPDLEEGGDSDDVDDRPVEDDEEGSSALIEDPDGEWTEEIGTDDEEVSEVIAEIVCGTRGCLR